MIYLCGDPHGQFGHIESIARRAVEMGRRASFIILGDHDLDVPLEKAIPSAAQNTWWIPGNHDGDSELWHDNLFSSALAERNLHGRVTEIEGLRVAGLGGVFRGKIWYPDQKRRYFGRQDFVRQMGDRERWRGGLSLRHRVSIWPDEFDALRSLGADILVCHEGPVGLGNHIRGGFAAIGRLAASMGVCLIAHGHHHRTYEDTTPEGVAIQGVGLRGIVPISKEAFGVLAHSAKRCMA